MNSWENGSKSKSFWNISLLLPHFENSIFYIHFLAQRLIPSWGEKGAAGAILRNRIASNRFAFWSYVHSMETDMLWLKIIIDRVDLWNGGRKKNRILSFSPLIGVELYLFTIMIMRLWLRSVTSFVSIAWTKFFCRFIFNSIWFSFGSVFRSSMHRAHTTFAYMWNMDGRFEWPKFEISLTDLLQMYLLCCVHATAAITRTQHTHTHRCRIAVNCFAREKDREN